MASGSIPLVLSWEGSKYFYPNEYIFDSIDKMVLFVKNKKSIDTKYLIDFIKKRYNYTLICKKIEELI